MKIVSVQLHPLSVRRAYATLISSEADAGEKPKERSHFLLIEARDLDDALRVAAMLPPARLGSVEVRPVRELDLF